LLLLWRPRNEFSFVHIVIEVNERIEVPSAPRIVWDILSDPYAVVECVPGAALGDKQEDGSYDATLTVKFGPAKVSFRARFTLELDAAGMTGQVTSKARDNQGGTRVKTSMAFKVVEGQAPGTSAIPITAQVEIAGKLASLVESGANLVVRHMTKEFSERLAARCAGVKAA
jgi:carbon monoxide dehydrogenase subunit G